MNEVYVSYNGTLYVPYIEVYVYWDVICSLHERITRARPQFLWYLTHQLLKALTAGLNKQKKNSRGNRGNPKDWQNEVRNQG